MTTSSSCLFRAATSAYRAIYICTNLLFQNHQAKLERVKLSRRKSPRRTETVDDEPVRRHIAVTVGRTHLRRPTVERAATQHTANLVIDTQNILFIVFWLLAFAFCIIQGPLLTPCIHISLHVEQTKIVGFQTPYRPRLLLGVLQVPRILRKQVLRF